MLLPKILLLCAFYNQMIHCHSPASLKALATLHARTAKALANALNLRARTQYNAAMAKARVSNLGLYGHRFNRDSDNNFSEEEQLPEFDPELNVNFPFKDFTSEEIEEIFGDSLEGHRIGDFIVKERNPLQVTNEDFVGRQQDEFNLNQEQPCLGEQLEENLNQGHLLQTPLWFDDLGTNKLSMYPVYEDEMIRSVTDQEIHENSFEGSSVENTGACLRCGAMIRSQDGDYGTDDRQITPDSNAGIQLPFNQEPGGPFTGFMNNQQADVPTIPLTIDYQNSNDVPQYPTMHPVFSTYPTTSARQGFLEEGIEENTDERMFEPQARTHEDASPDFDGIEEAESADPIARHRLHGHKKIHSLHPNIHFPTTQVISPGVNVHVVQNQNAVLGPQFATNSIQPGLHTAVVHPRPTLHDTHFVGPIHPNVHSGHTGAQLSQITGHGTGINQAQVIQTHSSPIIPNAGQFGHNLGGNVIYAGGGSQFKNIHADSAPVLPDNQKLFVSPHIGGNTFSQSQTIHQGAREDSSGDEKVGTFLNSAPMEAPEYHFDPNQPENRQGIVKYIENEQANIRRFLHIIENNQYDSNGGDQEFDNNDHVYSDETEEYNQQFDDTDPHFFHENNLYDREAREHVPKLNRAKNVPEELDNARMAEPNFQNEKVGTINMDHIPENFEEFETDLRRHLEAEQRSVQNMLDQINQNYQRGMESLSTLIDINDGHLHNPAHFQNAHNADSNGHIQVEEVDVPDGDNIEKFANPYQLDEQVGKSEDTKSLETLLDKNAQEDRLGHIIQIPDRRYSEDYQRQARSFNQTTVAKLDKLLLKEKKLISDLKKDAKHDEDMMMIGYIGDSLIDDLENRLNTIRRGKREIGDSLKRLRYLPLRRLVTDPKVKFDMSKTLENLGAVTRDAFEHEKAPMYHVRNMVGSAQDAVMAAMKIPTKNFLIPSAYDIVSTQGDNDAVGAINPGLFSRNRGENLRGKGPIDEFMSTFQKVGSAIRGSVKSGQEALDHVGNVANHAKSAIHSTKYTTPRLILKNIPAISREPKKKAMLITPRIFDISAEDNQVGSALGKQEPDFVKVGHILDAVGVSNPNSNLEFEKIVIEPRSSFSDFDLSEKPKIKHPSLFKDLLENIKIEKIKRAEDEDFLGNTLNTLNDARSTVGANNLKDFIVQMRHKFKKLLNATQANRKSTERKLDDKITQNQTLHENSVENQTGMTQTTHTQEESSNQNINQQNTERQENHTNCTEADSPEALDEETVGISLLPEEIRHPFLGQATLAQREQFIRENSGGDTDRVGIARKQYMQNNYEEVGTTFKDRRQADRDLGQILGAINPMMFERIFNETLKINNTHSTPHSVFHHHHNGRSHGHHYTEDASEEDKVGTSMTMKGQMLKPFRGQASDSLKQEFFGNYKPMDDMHENEDNEYSSEDTEFDHSSALEYENKGYSLEDTGSEHSPELAQWIDIFHPFHESGINEE